MITTILFSLLLLFTAASWIYWLIALALVRVFLGAGSEPAEQNDFTPPVSVLKPVKGLDFDAYENFASFCDQDYPQFELLFGVASPADPAVQVIERLQRDHGDCRIRLVATPDVIGANRKVSSLHHLAATAKHDVLVVNDSDMRVTPDYLRRVVAPLADETVGLVTCLYRGAAPRTFTARLEALHMGLSFLPSVVVGRLVLGMRFALGASNTLRRRDLDRIGGFAVLADCLADDYQLGARILALGQRIHLSHYIMVTHLGDTTFREQWDREVRWMQCNRVSRPAEYPGLWLTYTLPLALILLAASGFNAIGWGAVATSLIVRWVVAWFILEPTDQQNLRRWLLWLPVRDCLSALVWLAGLLGRRVEWRGESFRLLADGRLQPLPDDGWRQRLAALPGRGLRWGVRKLDAFLRRAYGIREFTTDDRCLFRLGSARSPHHLTLADGVEVQKGDAMGGLHYWNEHIPPMPAAGADVAWARTFYRGLTVSLRLLAEHVATEPAWQDVHIFGGDLVVGGQHEMEMISVLTVRLGAEISVQPEGHGLWQRFAHFWQDFYTRMLIWTYNPASLRSRRRGHRRFYLAISRQTLLRRYGPESGPAPASAPEP